MSGSKSWAPGYHDLSRPLADTGCHPATIESAYYERLKSLSPDECLVEIVSQKRGTGLFVIVNKGALPVLRGRFIKAHNGMGKLYAATTGLVQDGSLNRKTILCHRLLVFGIDALQSPEVTGLVVHHKNGITIDNTWANLEPTLKKYNDEAAETVAGSSGYKGVVVDKQRQTGTTYRVRLKFGGHSFQQFFKDPREAAEAYDQELKRLCNAGVLSPTFVCRRLNTPDPQIENMAWGIDIQEARELAQAAERYRQRVQELEARAEDVDLVRCVDPDEIPF